MATNFHVELRKSNGNLHVSPKGDFDGSSASELVNVLHEQYDGKGRVFIDTNKLREMYPFGCAVFQCRLNPRRLPTDRLFFKGEKGHEMAPKGSKVLVTPDKERCGCNGDCAKCPCSQKKN